MKLSHISSSRILGVAVLAGLWSVACSSNNNDNNNNNSTPTGGSTATSTLATGGKVATGGKAAATGGLAATGGAPAGTGGAPTGGAPAGTGGAPTGGAPAGTGGAATGGVTTTDTSTTAGGAATGGVSSTSTSTTAGGATTGGVTGTDTSTTAGGAATGGVTGTSTTAGGAATGGTTGTSTSTTCPIVYDWEGADAAGWSVEDGSGVTLAVSTAQFASGAKSLMATLPAFTSTAAVDGGAAQTCTTKSVLINNPGKTAGLFPGATVSLKVYVPAGLTGAWAQAFTLSNGYANFVSSATVNLPATAGWITIPFTVPTADKVFPGGVNQFGLQIGVCGGASVPANTVIYIDDITICGGSTTCTGTGTKTYDWETAGSVDSWAIDGNPSTADTAIAQSADFAKTGTGSLKVTFTALPASASSSSLTSRRIYVQNPLAFCGAVVSFNVYTPAAAVTAGLFIQAFGQTDDYASFPASANATLTADSWVAIPFTVPTYGFGGIQRLGVQISNGTAGAFTGSVYIDDVTWQ